MQDTKNEYALKLTQIFTDKNWEVIDDQAFIRALNFLCALEKETANMFLTLLVDFIWLKGHIQAEILSSLNEKILHERLLCGKTVYILPFYKKNKYKDDDFIFSRSGNGIMYLLQTMQYNKNLFDARKVVFCDTYENIPKTLGTEKAVVYIDDFIGTGKSGEEALVFLLKKRPFISDNIKNLIVLTLACTPSGRDFITEKFNCRLFFDCLVPKGISDNFKLSSQQKDDFTVLMRAFEEEINVKEEFYFGYGQSECLLTMSKTPNNTFPAFWQPPRGKLKYSPIFERQ